MDIRDVVNKDALIEQLSEMLLKLDIKLCKYVHNETRLAKILIKSIKKTA